MLRRRKPYLRNWPALAVIVLALVALVLQVAIVLADVYLS
jgi:hypothetical protein